MSDIEIKLEPQDEFNINPMKPPITTKVCISMCLTTIRK